MSKTNTDRCTCFVFLSCTHGNVNVSFINPMLPVDKRNKWDFFPASDAQQEICEFMCEVRLRS